jgi:hypothetical protein
VSAAKPTPMVDRQGELQWLAEVLWGPTPGVELVVGLVPSGFRRLDGWVVLPDLRHPRVLVPLASRRAAAASVRQYSDGMTRRARLAKAAVGTALRSGALQWLLRRRRQVVHAGMLDPLHGGPPAGGAGETLLGDYLAETLGRRDLAAAIVLGPVRPNRKPVVQLLAPDGRPVGYMKVGWNDLTRRLVRNEARALRRLAERQPRTFTVPSLLHEGTWQGLDVTVSSALPHRLWRRGRRYATPPLAVSREVAALGGVQTATLGASPWWEDLRRRLDPVRAAATGAAADALAGTLERLQQQADTPLAFASWHGDWGPWNLRATADRLLVWDWERSGDGVPLGFDLLHFGYQTAFQGLRQPPAEAAARSLRRAAPLLAELGQREEVGELLLTLYLLERVCRAAEAEPSAVTGRPDAAGAGLLDVLGQRLEGEAGR